TGGAAPRAVVRTGMGPRGAGGRAAALAAAAPRGYGAVLVAGFCAALGPGLLPGEVIVADRVLGPGGAAAATTDPAALARSLEALGLPVRTGALHSSDHLVRGAERRALHRTGALAVDMESAAVLAALPAGLPVAALRVVVDTPERELLRPGTVPGGLRAWRTLRAAVPALIGWHRAVPAPSAGPAAPRAIPQLVDPARSTHDFLPTLPQEAS
ncbi:hypothetical protein, partial [Kitasatospora nipponensis]|uniref:phosphorylase family protein n=1 Tax=Kitasatospora nipponensis TaxID=258049 RepID=UPI0031E15D46